MQFTAFNSPLDDPTEMEMQFSMASSIHQTLVHCFRKMRDRILKISSCIKFKAKQMFGLRRSFECVAMNKILTSNAALLLYIQQVEIESKGRSPRIVELDARKAQERSQNKGNVICEVTDEEELDEGQDVLKQKRGRKKVKVRTVQDLVVNSVEYKVQKTDTGNDEDGLVNAAIVPSGAALPDKHKLKQLLDTLRRRDKYEIFQEPVNPEKVDRYYDVIKEPMDLGTVAKKLNEGSYQTLEEFEHDVILVPNNAMLFNASSTVYYRQARAMKELATRLFHALKTDPENFEAEAESSIRRVRPGRRTKAGVRILKNKSNTSIAQRGSKSQGRHDVDVERRHSCRPQKSFLSDNGSLVSAVYNSPKQLDLVNNVGGAYVESLTRFSKDLGPIAQKVAMKKVDSCLSESMRVWITTTNHQPLSPNMQIPNAAFASNIKVAPSIQVPSSIPGFQNISDDKMNIHGGFSNGGQASTDFRMTINNAFSGGISQPGGRVESPGHFLGNMTPSASRGFAPSLHLLGNSNGCQTFAGETMDSPSFFWNGGKVSAVNNVNTGDPLNKGKGKLADEWGFQEKAIQPMRVAWDGDATFGDYAADHSNGVHLDSSFPYNVDRNDALNRGKGKSRNGINIEEKMLQPTRMVWDGGAVFKDYNANRNNGVHLDSSFPNNVVKNYASNKGKENFRDGMDFSEEMLPPMRVSLDAGLAFKDYAPIISNGVHLDSLFPNNMDMNDDVNRIRGKLGDGIGFQEKMLQPMRVGLDGGAALKDYDANQSNGVHLDFSFPIYHSGKEKLDFTALLNTKGKQKELGETGMMVNPINVDNTAQKARHASSWWMMQESMPKSNIGASSSSLPPPSRVMTGLNGIQTIGSHYPCEGMWGKEVIADGEGSSHRTNVVQGGVVSDFSKPPQIGVQPSSEFFFQDGNISAELASLLQTKQELDSLCEAPIREHCFGFSQQEKVMGASQKALGYEKFQPESSGAAAERSQKQTMEGAELGQWRWI